MRPSTQLSATLLLLAALFGCNARHDASIATLQDRYQQIQGGMTFREVRSLLGPGRKLTKTDGLDLHIKGLPQGNPFVWQDGQTSITVVFEDDVVVAKLRAVAPATK